MCLGLGDMTICIGLTKKKCIVSYYVLSFISWCRKIHCLRWNLFIIFIKWLRSFYAAHRRSVKERQNEELVPKRGTTYVACVTDFKHCSFKTTVLKPLKHKQSYMRVASFLCERSTFFSYSDFEQLHKYTYMCQNPRLCKYPHKHSDLGLKKENGRKRKHICNSN